MQGARNIELLPSSIDDRRVDIALGSLLQRSKSLRASIAYWCVGVGELGDNLPKKLSGDGYLCVDIHLPTDIDILADLHQRGANVYLHLFNPNPQPSELKSKVPPHLLHTKMLLFDLGHESELWVGSHNWTARALTGVNLEASLRVQLDSSAALLRQSSLFLDGIRSKCVRFDIDSIDYYKWLQGQPIEEPVWVLELRGNRADLDNARRLTVFGQREEDYKNLKSVDMNIVISLFDENTNKEYLYEATISDTGRLRSAGLNFDARLYAAHNGRDLPILSGPAVPPRAITAEAQSWATVSVVEELDGETREMPPAERWVTVEGSGAYQRSGRNLQRWFPDPDRPLIQKAASPVEFYQGPSAEMHSQIGLVSSMALIRRKIVKASRKNGKLFKLSKRRPSEDER